MTPRFANLLTFAGE